MTGESFTYWVCVDCYYAANGIDEHERGEAYPDGVLSLVPDGANVTTGLVAAEHEPDCPAFPANDDGTREDFTGAECGCESIDFTWRACDGCGSTLGGSREALTVWEEETPRERALRDGVCLGQYEDHADGCDFAEGRSGVCTCAGVES